MTILSGVGRRTERMETGNMWATTKSETQGTVLVMTVHA